MKYLTAQQASTKQSTSDSVCINLDKTGRACSILTRSTEGVLPRHKFDKHHTAFRLVVNFCVY